MQPAEKSSQKRDRGAMEKQRRVEMKNLYSKLASLLPSQPSKEKLPLPALLDHALTHVKEMKERVEELKVEKERLQALVLPSVVVNEMGSFLEVNLLTGLKKSFMLPEVLSILEGEGAVVLNVNYATLSDRILYTICCQPYSSRIGINTSSVRERLKALSGSELAAQHNDLEGTSKSAMQ